MNIYSLIGFLLSVIVFCVGVATATDQYAHFWDWPALLIVLGGTFAAMSTAFQLDRVLVLMKLFFQRVILGKRADHKEIIREIMTICEGYRKGESLEQYIAKTKDDFLKEALTLVHENVLEGDDLFDVLDSRVENLNYLYMEEANKLKAAGKYPPAFGLMGTTIGMIVLMGSLGGADALKKVGPAMSVCLAATLYGVTIANFFIIPMGENLIDSSREIYLKNKIIVEGVNLMIHKTNPIVLSEKLNSFLSPHQRLDWKKANG
jgi:chemotaxis protein MotA